MMVWNGRLPGATTFGLLGVEAEAVAAVLQADAERRASTTPEPKPM